MLFNTSDLMDELQDLISELSGSVERDGRIVLFVWKIVKMLETASKLEGAKFLKDSDTRNKEDFLNEMKGFRKAYNLLLDITPKDS